MTQNTAHFNMLEQQIRPSNVLNFRVLAALKQVKREHFVDPSLSGLAYADTALPIGFGQFILAPVISGQLLQALDLQADEHILEIGTGSGYFTALLAQLAQHVTTVEIEAQLSNNAKNQLETSGINNVTYHIGDASQGWDLADRIEVIIATAAFDNEVPEQYLQSLVVGGRMLAVVGKPNNMSVQLIRRIAERQWQTESLFETVIPAMINGEVKAKFEF